MRIGIVQPEMSDWDWEKREGHACELAMQLRDQRPDIICFPEMYPGRTGKLEKCSKELGAYILCGKVDKPPLKSRTYYNSAALISPGGKRVGVYQKILLMDNEKAFGYQPGKAYQVFVTPLGRIGVLICADFPLVPETSAALVQGGADVVIVPSMAVKSLLPYWQMFLLSRSTDNGIPTIFVNTAGDFIDQGTTYGGGQSQVVLPLPPDVTSLEAFFTVPHIDTNDQILFRMEDNEAAAVVEVDLKQHAQYRSQIQQRRDFARSRKVKWSHDR